MKQVVELAEQEQVILGAFVRPFEVMLNPGNVELDAFEYAHNRKIFVGDFDGKPAASMRRILRESGFEGGFDDAGKGSKDWNQYHQIGMGLFDCFHVYIPKSVDETTRIEFIDNYFIGTEFPVLKLSSLLADKFDHVLDIDSQYAHYKLRGKDAFLRISAIGNHAIFKNWFLRISVLSGNDSEFALQELQQLAEIAQCALIGITTPTPPESRFNYYKDVYEQVLRANGFEQDCPLEVLGVECSGSTAFQLLWMPSTIDENIAKAVKILSESWAEIEARKVGVSA